MKKTTFYPTIWQTIPYSFDMIEQLEKDGSTSNFGVILQKIRIFFNYALMPSKSNKKAYSKATSFRLSNLPDAPP